MLDIKKNTGSILSPPPTPSVVGIYFGSILFRPPPPPSVFYDPPVTIYMLLYGKLLCKKIPRAPGVIKSLCSLS